jgi:hypothetical protein
MTLTQTMLCIVDLCSLVYHRQNLDQKKNNQNMVISLQLDTRAENT